MLPIVQHIRVNCTVINHKRTDFMVVRVEVIVVTELMNYEQISKTVQNDSL